MLEHMPVFQSEKLKKFPELVHGTLGPGAREKAQGAFDLKNAELFLGQQVHGRRVKVVGEQGNKKHVSFLKPKIFLKTDGLLTKQTEKYIGIQTADCIPAVLYDPVTGWVGALHIGWRSAVSGIMEEALRKLRKQEVKLKDLRVWLGPSICGKCYDFQDRNHARILEERLGFKSMWIRGKFYFDLKAAVAKKFLQAGILKGNLEVSKICTKEDLRLPSARRSGGKVKLNALSFIGRQRSIYDLAGKKVLVYGLGIQGGGEACALYAAQQSAEVYVADDKPAEFFEIVVKNLHKFPIKYAFGPAVKKFVEKTKFDLVIKNPGLNSKNPVLNELKRSKVFITSDLSIFRARTKNPIIAITGTKGKTTTALWLARMLSSQGRVVTAGNLKSSPLLQRSAFDGQTPVVLETSSFQLEDLTLPLKPKLAILTNLYPDHLNRHKTMASYQRAKFKVFSGQDKSDFVILPSDNGKPKFSIQNLKARIFWTSFNYKPNASAWIGSGNLFLKISKKPEKIISVNRLKLKDKASMRNAINVALAARLLGVSISNIRKGLRTFKGAPERFERIRVYKSRTFINNTTATNPFAAISALESLPKGSLVICGGENKGLDFRLFAKKLNQFARLAVVLPGTASNRIWPLLKITKKRANSMPEAVKLAWQFSKPKDRIILNPGAASFGLFKNEFDRGEKFLQAVKKIR
ncbi:UDP-N-acetylmuramoyl-L-alanine--D-glutamate ligase [Candidatus Parcubacteria bacterium]|jgi:UDP-N-acetylmuramoylalanine--D-glutamate ligase|nr:MAG: UDP-N-acetylmuramoyl-L-alanine--D-glutamate ligase [Candidatus Parcubacteria bacterium]